MRTLILVKHSVPEQRADLPAREWQLAETGRLRCAMLAARLAPYRLAHLIASAEPKAVETAQLVATTLDLPYRIVPGLHEHDRSHVPYLSDAAFQANVERFFAQPDRLVFGKETASAARGRFTKAVQGIVARASGGTIAIVAHGTVISLFVAQAASLDPVSLWRRLGLPSFVVLSLPDYQVVEIVEAVDTR